MTEAGSDQSSGIEKDLPPQLPRCYPRETVPTMSRRAPELSPEDQHVSPGEAAAGADLGGGSKQSNQSSEG